MEEKKKKKWNLEEERDQGRNLTKREKKNYRVYIYIYRLIRDGGKQDFTNGKGK